MMEPGKLRLIKTTGALRMKGTYLKGSYVEIWKNSQNTFYWLKYSDGKTETNRLGWSDRESADRQFENKVRELGIEETKETT